MPKSAEKTAKAVKPKINDERLRELAEEATADSNDDSEQVMGLYYSITDELELPFDTEVLGVKVTVESVELDDRDEIVAVCRNGSHRQRIAILDLPLPSPPPKGSEWIEAYRWWTTNWR